LFAVALAQSVNGGGRAFKIRTLAHSVLWVFGEHEIFDYLRKYKILSLAMPETASCEN